MGALNVAALLAAALPMHIVPLQAPPISRAPISANGTPPTCTGTCNLQYWGGHVISNVKVYAIFWGSGVDAATQSGIGDFYTALTNSEWVDWQNEYRTDITAVGGGAGTGQLIGRGTFAGAITIAPSASATCAGRATALPDATIQNELIAQIGAGNVPPPDANTLYMIYFPPGCQISGTDGTSKSCVQFCAYHGTFVLGGHSVFYGIVPDFGAGSGCDLGCGRGTTFQNICSASSHEAGEAMTDAEVGIVTTFAPPLGWYDNPNGENGDMCNQVTGTITSLATGASYTVQQMYSQTTGLCQLSRTNANDFNVFMNPNVATLGAGGGAVIPVRTTVTAGSPGTLRLALGPLPAGVTGAFDATSLAAGQSTQLRLSAASSAAAVTDAVVVVTACGGSGACPSAGVPAHTASLLLQVTRVLPSISLSVSPSASGTVPISATATPAAASGAAIASISISIDGVPVASGVASPLAAIWDTTQVANGSHLVKAVATDADGQSNSTEVPVVVTNDFSFALVATRGSATIGASPATFTITTSAIGGPEPITFTSSGLASGVSATFDPASVQAGSPSTLTLSAAAGVTPGGMTFSVIGKTRSVPAGHPVSSGLFVIRAPVASVTVSATGNVSGKVTVTATATVDPNAHLVRLDVKDGDSVIATGAAASLSSSWDTTTVANGTHAISAVVVDDAGNSVSSSPVSVTVANASTSGCSSAGASGFEALALVMVAAAARRRRRAA